MITIILLIIYFTSKKKKKMRFLPKNVFKGTNSDGSTFTANEWDYNTLANIQGASFLVILIISLLLCSVLSPILLIICIVMYNGKINALSLIGALIGLYFLIDCYNDWLAIMALGLFCDANDIKLLIAFNVASLITHIVMMTANESLYRYNKLFYLIIGIVFLGGIVIGCENASNIGKLRLEAIKKYETVTIQN